MLETQLPPPGVYLLVPKMGEDGKWWYFTDVEILELGDSSTPDIQPMRGNRAPLVTEGAGNGTMLQVNANLNSWHQFLSSQQTSRASGRVNSTPYDDYLEIIEWYEQNSPSPEVIFIQEDRPEKTMIMTDFATRMHLSESVPGSEGRKPSAIAVTFTLLERHPYKVVVY